MQYDFEDYGLNPEEFFVRDATAQECLEAINNAGITPEMYKTHQERLDRAFPKMFGMPPKSALWFTWDREGNLVASLNSP